MIPTFGRDHGSLKRLALGDNFDRRIGRDPRNNQFRVLPFSLGWLVGKRTDGRLRIGVQKVRVATDSRHHRSSRALRRKNDSRPLAVGSAEADFRESDLHKILLLGEIFKGCWMATPSRLDILLLYYKILYLATSDQGSICPSDRTTKRHHVFY